ncbi:unnamed protein product, partial [Prorocentrum cordatum]
MWVALSMQQEWRGLPEGVQDHFLNVCGSAQMVLSGFPQSLFTPSWWRDRRGPARHLRDVLQGKAPHRRPRHRDRAEANLKEALRMTEEAEVAWRAEPRCVGERR